MVIVNVDHPDILEFIRSKATEEKKAQALVQAGYDGSLEGEAYATVAFQNSNHSVRVADEFMEADEADSEWNTRFVVSGEVADTYRARDLLREIAGAAHACGDPGIQFDTTINRWHTCPETAPIRASNPCSEYMHVDDSACNLSSLKLTAFLDAGDLFRADAFRHSVDIMITAQDILVDKASYPTPAITRNSRGMRALGLGYADLGALIMALGLPYDSDEGRAWASTITAIMTGEAYVQSARIASVRSPFSEFQKKPGSNAPSHTGAPEPRPSNYPERRVGGTRSQGPTSMGSRVGNGRRTWLRELSGHCRGSHWDCGIHDGL